MTVDQSDIAQGQVGSNLMRESLKDDPSLGTNTPTGKKQTSLLSFFSSPTPKRTEREGSTACPQYNSPSKKGRIGRVGEGNDESLLSLTSSFYEMRSDSEQDKDDFAQLASETGMLDLTKFKLDDSSSPGAKAELPLRALKHNQLKKIPGDVEEVDGQENNANDEERYKWLVDIKDAQGHSPNDTEYDCRTLYIPKSAWNKFTPFEKQYWEIKKELLDTVVFFKKGKFYELYEMDADIGSKEFDLKMIDRVNMRLVGVPEATFEMWAARFVAAGHKVARVDQTETSVGKTIREKDGGAKEKGEKIIRRELTCILTAGTITEPAMLPSDTSSYCIAIKEKQVAVRPTSDEAVFGMAILDAATGTIRLCDFEDDRNRSALETFLIQLQPTEILLEKGRISPDSKAAVKRSAPAAMLTEALPDKEYPSRSKVADTLDKEGYFRESGGDWPKDLRTAHDQQRASFEAFGALLHYLRVIKLDGSLLSYANIGSLDLTARVSVEPTKEGVVGRATTLMLVDGQSLVNLDIIPTSLRTSSSLTDAKRGTLLGIIDHCNTSFGRRLLNLWLCHPLASAHAIRERQQAIEHLLAETGLSHQLWQHLSALPDLERALSRIHSGTIKLKDFIAAIDGFQKVLHIKEMLLASVGLAQTLAKAIPSYKDTIHYFATSFDRALALKEGMVIPQAGVSKDYDAANERYRQVQGQLDAYLKEQEALLGMKGIRYRDVGKEIYQLEVPAETSVPREYMLMSKTKAAKRYWTPTIRALVKEHAEWEERRAFALRDVYADLLHQFGQHTRSIWRSTVEQVARIDCLLSLARASELMAYPKCLPQLVDEGSHGEGAFLDVTDLRHPCAADPASFIPNDIKLGASDGSSSGDRVLLLTGPNMGGKSTLLRQVCLAVILAQIGCYVPASACRLAPIDRIFTRLGANDNIIAGKSTFLVELLDAAKILKEATPRSLVILDELGRGTSTFDGMAIAHSVLLYLVRRSRSLTLFATHYRPLAMDCLGEAGINCSYMNCLTDAESKRVTFLYKLVPGVSPKSYGMNVAAMAGLPQELIEEADIMAEAFEQELSLCLDAAYGKVSRTSLSRTLCRTLIDVICPPNKG